MAIVNSLYLRGAKQKLAGAVFYQQSGRTLARELAPEVSNPRTPSQMGQRVKWANLVKFYQANKGWMKKAFENKKATQSDYNKFMQMNVPFGRVYLTKTEAAAGACIVDAFRVADGSLPPVQLEKADDGWSTNLYIGDLDELGGEETVAYFSQVLLSHNGTLKQGDQISFVRVTQTTDNFGIPRIQVRAYEMVINTNNPAFISDYLPVDLLKSVVYEGVNHCVGVVNNGNMGAFAILVSRTTGSKTLVSTADLTLVNMGEFLSSYTNAIQLEKAAASYGVNEDVFLDSDNAEPIISNPTSFAPMYVKIREQMYNTGAVIGQCKTLYGQRVEIVFNKPIEANSARLYIQDNQTTDDWSATISGNSVFASVPASTFTHVDPNKFIETIGATITGKGSFYMKFSDPAKDMTSE